MPALGTMEILTDLTFLIRENGLVSARKQHRELPPQIPDHKIQVMAVLMLLFGCVVYTSAVSCNTLTFSISRDLLLTEQMTPSLSNCPSLRLTVSLATPR